jgi:hypothetical protein
VRKEQLKTLLTAWRGDIMPAAQGMMNDLFNSAGEVMLEYAEKAESNAIQVRFFEGKRELWLKEEQVVSLFNENLFRDLFDFMRPAERRDAPGAEVLSLVSKDAYERSLALQTIADQAVQDHQELYYALAQRLGVVTGGPALEFADVPAGPHQLVDVFERSAHVLNVEREVLLAIYTLFEREVIRKSPPWHEELNESLRQAGILPNLKYQVKIKPGQATLSKAQPTGSTAAGAPGFGGFIGHAQSAAGAAAQGVTGGARSASAGPRHAGGGQTAGGAAGSRAHSAAGGARQPAGAGQGRARGAAYGGAPGTEGLTDGSQATAARDSDLELGDQLLGRIRELLTTRRMRQNPDGTATMRPDPVAPAPPVAVAAVIDSPQVQNFAPLPETGARETGVRQVVVSRTLLEKLRRALSTQREQIKDMVGDEKLSHVDEDTIDIVGMLFEVMLNDDRLANTVKALLSHLHTPYLKLAVRDRSFLRYPEHPARRLFDKMVEAGLRWVDERDLTRGMYPKLQWVVDAVSHAGEYSAQLFEQYEAELSADIQLLSERQQTREVRTLETEKGKARLEEAREVAGQTAQAFLMAAAAPQRYQDFMTGPWTDYLTLLYLRSNGNINTANWQGAQELGRRLRSFIDGLATGARPDDAELKALHDELRQRLGDAIPHYERKVQQLFELFSPDEEIVLTDIPHVAIAPAAASAVSPEEIKLSKGGKSLLKRLPQLPPGSWVSFHGEGEDPDQIVKLSWFNPKTERFLFVDQAGAKALVMSLRELANRFEKEGAQVLHATGTSYVE